MSPQPAKDPNRIYEDYTRLLKAQALVIYLDVMFYTSERARSLTQEAWKTAASSVGVAMPSPRTQQLVIDLLRIGEMTRERLKVNRVKEAASILGTLGAAKRRRTR